MTSHLVSDRLLGLVQKRLEHIRPGWRVTWAVAAPEWFRCGVRTDEDQRWSLEVPARDVMRATMRGTAGQIVLWIVSGEGRAK